MNRIEKLIHEIRNQLLPYHHEHDVEQSCERWEVEDRDCLTSWVVDQLTNCRQRNRCAKRGMCVYYSYSDIAKKNYEICREVTLLFESGEAQCIIGESREKE
jgi:hypothetical protein